MSDYYELTISSTDFDDLVWIRELVAVALQRDIEAENIITRCEHGTNILGDDSSDACQDCIDEGDYD